ncbi:hypothetical protein [Thiohalophilus thiocyanatoxydans]|uniref:Lipoprotein n=1 Tax=Thiohalophilus thiocyanatoxydans TaxID=381308 RepID=A0A4V3H4A4_9GAMM|nr:hypothetical protein [Thiohalophilus thiocyanatoxydans]TDY02385.1 hypothetical protein EDC23_0753 [Thiohalophilus thiocyanatoxydans]
MRLKLFLLPLAFFVITACAGNPESNAARQCERGLKTAYQELDFAKAKGFSGTMEYTKAASLLTAAKVQSEFGKYPNCIDKVERARAYIRLSQK